MLAVGFAIGSCQGLENAVANGDTRTFSLHHIHTGEDITITFKVNGRYDEEALKKLDHFVRDWRKEEEVHMDPRLYDLVWEASREVGGEKTIHIVCGYRSPGTNAMLRRRSTGVAQHSQHMLGKAMDFFIPGASLEELRYTGLRLQRGGVGYYPTSGSPFVHLDVGPVRHWPRMPADQLAKVLAGQPTHLATNGRTGAVPAAGGRAAATTVADAGAQRKGWFSSLIGRNPDDDDEGDAGEAAAPAVAKPAATKPAATPPVAPAPALPTAAKRNVYTVASIDPKPETIRPAATPAPVVTPAAPAAVAAQSRVVRPPAAIPPAENVIPAADANASGSPWPVRPVERDRVPLDMVLAYAAPPERTVTGARAAEPAANAGARVNAPAPVRTQTIGDNVTTVSKKNFVRAPGPETIARVKPTIVAVAAAGMRYDDPWLRAMILAPSLAKSMTITLYGEPNLAELRALMVKPANSIPMTFNDEPYPGMTSNRFSGESVVFLATQSFDRRTASLR